MSSSLGISPASEPVASRSGGPLVLDGRRGGWIAAWLLAATVWVVAAHAAHAAGSKHGIPDDPPGASLRPGIFARINGIDIPRTRFLADMDRALGDMFREVFIAHVLVEAKAEASGVAVSEQELEASVSRTIEQVRAGRVEGDGDHLEDALHQRDMSLEGWKRRLRFDQRQDLLLDKLILRDREISEDGLKRAFEDKYGKNGIQTKIRHIQRIVDVAASQDYTHDQFEKEVAEIDRVAKARAEEALKKLRAGESWDRVLSEYSDDLRKGSGGVLIEWKGRFGPEFDAAASSLKKNELSEVFGGAEGYRILQCINVSDASQFHAQHILVATGASGQGRTIEQSRKKAEVLLAKIKAGADFSTLARENSEDTSSAPKGGDLGWFGPKTMNAQFEDAARTLEPGQVSELVRSGYGFHIIKLLETKPSESRDVRQILLSTKYSIVRDHKIRPVLEAKARAILEDAIKQLASPGTSFAELAKRFSEDAATKESGGLISTFKEGYYGGEFDDAVKTLKPGEPPRIVKDHSGNLHLLFVESSVKTVFADVRGSLSEEMMKRPPTQQERSEYVKKLRAKASVAL